MRSLDKFSLQLLCGIRGNVYNYLLQFNSCINAIEALVGQGNFILNGRVPALDGLIQIVSDTNGIKAFERFYSVLNKVVKYEK